LYAYQRGIGSRCQTRCYNSKTQIGLALNFPGALPRRMRTLAGKGRNRALSLAINATSAWTGAVPCRKLRMFASLTYLGGSGQTSCPYSPDQAIPNDAAVAGYASLENPCSCHVEPERTADGAHLGHARILQRAVDLEAGRALEQRPQRNLQQAGHPVPSAPEPI
jgi:hypothetical protein